MGCLLGGAAAILTALADYGAHWLWIGGLRDRLLFLVALLGLQVPIGALVGGLLGAAIGVSDTFIERAAIALGMDDDARAKDVLRALRLAVLLSPGLVIVGCLLFTGGSMSRLPFRALLQVVTCGALIALAFATSYAAHRLAGWSRLLPSRKALLLGGALLAGFALGKVNQWTLPNLYNYLHGSLAVGTFLCFMAAGWLYGESRVSVRAWPHQVALLAALVAVSIVGLSATLARLDQNQNVRVALLHSDVPHSRAVMQTLAPLFIEPVQRRAMKEARRKARLARAAQNVKDGPSAGPVIEDAHVLLVTIDALRPDHLGYHGYKRPTSPKLDQFAAQSVVFERAYAPAPHSSYSLCSMQTSEYLHETLDLDQPLPKATLASVLGEAGYHTAAFYSGGIFHTGAERLRPYEQGAFGFALSDQVTYEAEELTDRVLKEVDRTVARGEPSAFFWVHYFDVHEPYRSTHFGTADVDRYDGEILHVDGALDRLIRETRRRLSRPVVIVITSDHGEEFREHGGVYHGSSLYDEQVRVPLLLNVPSIVAARRVAAPVETIDVAPTVLGLLDLPAPRSMRGKDLRAAAQGRPHSGPVFSAVTHKKMVVRWPYKLIADLRFGLFELYDLERDPGERDNLADRKPELLSELRAEVYVWLDSLAPRAASAQDLSSVALAWGRLRDRRAVEPLSALVADSSAKVEMRVEAARLLGHLADKRAALSLVRAMNEPSSPWVVAEAAIALGRMYDPAARDALQRLVDSEDKDLRVRAAVSLGRLRDPLAVPALIEALWVAENEYERQEAVRWLGRLRDARALGPLIDLLPELRTRFLVVVAIGMIGDRRAYDTLAQVLTWDQHANVRDATLQGLGLLGDPRAIELIMPLAADDPTLEFASEGLVRLGAVDKGAIGGTDIGPATRGLRGFKGCVAGSLVHDWDYLHRTLCNTDADTSSMPVHTPPSIAQAAHGVQVVLGLKRRDSAAPATVRLSIGKQDLGEITVGGSWQEHRVALAPGALPAGTSTAVLTSVDKDARFTVDHLLLLPRTSAVVAQRAP